MPPKVKKKRIKEAVGETLRFLGTKPNAMVYRKGVFCPECGGRKITREKGKIICLNCEKIKEEEEKKYLEQLTDKEIEELEENVFQTNRLGLKVDEKDLAELAKDIIESRKGDRNGYSK